MGNIMYDTAKPKIEQAIQDWIDSLQNQTLYIQAIKTINKIDEPPADVYDLLLSIFLGYWVETYDPLEAVVLSDVPQRFLVGASIPYRFNQEIVIDNTELEGADSLIFMDEKKTLLFVHFNGIRSLNESNIN